MEIKSRGKEGAITTIEQDDHKAMTAPWRDDVSCLKGEWKGLAVGQSFSDDVTWEKAVVSAEIAGNLYLFHCE